MQIFKKMALQTTTPNQQLAEFARNGIKLDLLKKYDEYTKKTN